MRYEKNCLKHVKIHNHTSMPHNMDLLYHKTHSIQHTEENKEKNVNKSFLLLKFHFILYYFHLRDVNANDVK